MGNMTLRLDANEGRPCLPPASLAALLDSETLRRYPDSSVLEAALAAGMGLQPERVIATAGADDAIDRAIRSFGRSGAAVLSTAPAFEEYAAAATRSGAAYSAVPRAPDGPFPLAALVAAIHAGKPALVVIASPDNPGGGTVSAAELRTLAQEGASACGAKVLFDVAYADFDEDREVYDIAVGEFGLRPSDLLFDALTFTVGAGDASLRDAAVQTIRAIRGIKAALPGVGTVLGVSNISFGLSPVSRKVLNSVFLHEAVEAGLDAASGRSIHRFGHWLKATRQENGPPRK